MNGISTIQNEQVDIKGLISENPSIYRITQPEEVLPIFKPRDRYAHKGDFGSALLVAGSYGMAGAAILGAKACLRTGVGLVTVHTPSCNREIIQIALPEAILSIDEVLSIDKYSAIAIGPGIGTSKEAAKSFEMILELLHKSAIQTNPDKVQSYRQHSETEAPRSAIVGKNSEKRIPLVVDADGLNLLSQHAEFWQMLPQGTILTPHVKEFERLLVSSGIAAPSENPQQRLQNARALAQFSHCFIVLKGAWSAIVSPEGNCHFNPTGNPGMATAGSGDVLTGIILSLLAQGFTAEKSAIIGAFLHGKAGDTACEKWGESGMIAGDMINEITNHTK